MRNWKLAFIVSMVLAFAPSWALAAEFYQTPVRIPGPGGAVAGHSFGRSFNGTNQALQSSATVDLTGTGTISVWFRLNQTAFQTNDAMAVESNSNSNVNGAIQIDPNSSACPQKFAFATHTSGGFIEQSFTPPSAGAWHSYLFVILMGVAGTNFKAYVDGSSVTTNVCVAYISGAGNFGNYTFNLMSRNSTTLWNAGSMSEFAIWKADESANASTLNGGTLPSSVDATNLVRYVHICGTASPEPDTQSGNWALTGTPPQVTGPGVINCP